MSSGSQLKTQISRKWPVITLCISLATHHKMGIQRNDKMSFLPNTVTTATRHLHKKNSKRKWHWILSFFVSFYGVKFKKLITYIYMELSLATYCIFDRYPAN